MEEFASFIEQLANKSGTIIRDSFLSSGLRVDLKADRSVVTQADRDAESCIRDLIRNKYPRHGILGEEFGAEQTDAEWVWVIDPIDGTLSFLSGVPLFGSLIGLLHHGKPVLGCIHQPITNLFCLGDGERSFLNGRPCQVRKSSGLSEATLLATDVQGIARLKNLGRYLELAQDCKLVRTWGDCYGYLLLAIGRADIMLDPIMNPWDILPIIPIVRGAGGVITSWEGEEAEGANSCIAALPELHATVVSRLSSASKPSVENPLTLG